MKRIVMIGLFVVLVGGIAYLARAVQIEFSWDYDYSVDPACTATVSAAHAPALGLTA